jgi:hypothetical protein
MAATWKIDNIKYYISYDNKSNVVHTIDYIVSDSKEVKDKKYTHNHYGVLTIDLDIVKAAEAVDAVLYTEKDTLLADKAVKIGDVKTPAVSSIEEKNPWASEDFVEYNDLTENLVIKWVKSTLGEDKVKQIEDDIATRIDEKENPPAPTEGSGVPW